MWNGPKDVEEIIHEQDIGTTSRVSSIGMQLIYQRDDIAIVEHSPEKSHSHLHVSWLTVREKI